MLRVSTLILLLISCAACSPRVQPDRTELDQALDELFTTAGIVTAGAGVIEDGELVWTGYYGEQSPGIPASRTTLFNVASITKTVATETVLRLVATGDLSLDEPMGAFWVDPDLADDPRALELTPRMVLTHTTGLPNWRWSNNGVLRFERDPDTGFVYSGEGFEWLARFVENKLGDDFETYVEDLVFTPLGMENASMSVRSSRFDQLAQAVDEDGTFSGHYCRPNGWCRPEGSYSTADDMVISVEDYARFLIASMNGTGLTEDLRRERDRVQANVNRNHATVDCASVSEEACPEAQGYGIGWTVTDYGTDQLIGHGGSDWSELAIAYFHNQSHDGIVLFLNAPPSRALSVMSDAIALLDPDSPMIDYYRRWHEAATTE
ncbi:MAG: serine hydrolase domain-containing protein [Acidobacteriota bacterium]